MSQDQKGPTPFEASAISVEETDQTLASSTPEHVKSDAAEGGLNLDDLRIEGDILGDVSVEQPFVTLPVRKPGRQSFFRVNPKRTLCTAVIELKDDGETFVVSKKVAAVLVGELRQVRLSLCITATGSLFLWPVPLPPADGHDNAWHKSARKAAEIAEMRWVRMAADRESGSYRIMTSPHYPEPTWPNHSMERIIEVAFGDGHIIDNLDHPVVRKLLGQP